MQSFPLASHHQERPRKKRKVGRALLTAVVLLLIVPVGLILAQVYQRSLGEGASGSQDGISWELKAEGARDSGFKLFYHWDFGNAQQCRIGINVGGVLQNVRNECKSSLPSVFPGGADAIGCGNYRIDASIDGRLIGIPIQVESGTTRPGYCGGTAPHPTPQASITPITVSNEFTSFPQPRFNTGIGLHWSADFTHKYDGDTASDAICTLQEIGVSWIKIVASDTSAVEFARIMKQNDIEPIVRLYRREPNPGTLPEKDLRAVTAYRQVGVSYFQTNNEPNLDVEWQGGTFPACTYAAEQMVKDWIQDALSVQQRGGYPIFPPLAPTDGLVENGRERACEDEAFLRTAFNWLAANECALADGSRGSCLYLFDQQKSNGKPAVMGIHSYTDTGDRSLVERYNAIVTSFLTKSVPILSLEGGMLFQDQSNRPTANAYNQHRDVTIRTAQEQMYNPLSYYFNTAYWLALPNRERSQWGNSGWFNFDLSPNIPQTIQALRDIEKRSRNGNAYTGMCNVKAAPADSTPRRGGSAPTTCSTEVYLNTRQDGENLYITYRTPADREGSVGIEEEFSGGVDLSSCTFPVETPGGSGVFQRSCKIISGAESRADYRWTHKWKNGCDSNGNNCSSSCSTATTFALEDVMCRPDNVNLEVKSELGNRVRFRVVPTDDSEGEGTAWPGNVFTPSENAFIPNSCTGVFEIPFVQGVLPEYGRVCTINPQNAGTYTWTHTWQRCRGSDGRNCSQTCSKFVNFEVRQDGSVTVVGGGNSIPAPTQATIRPTTTPTPCTTRTPAPTTEVNRGTTQLHALTITPTGSAANPCEL